MDVQSGRRVVKLGKRDLSVGVWLPNPEAHYPVAIKRLMTGDNIPTNTWIAWALARREIADQLWLFPETIHTGFRGVLMITDAVTEKLA